MRQLTLTSPAVLSSLGTRLYSPGLASLPSQLDGTNIGWLRPKDTSCPQTPQLW